MFVHFNLETCHDSENVGTFLQKHLFPHPITDQVASL